MCLGDESQTTLPQKRKKATAMSLGQITHLIVDKFDKLFSYLQSVDSKEFKLGKFDCFKFANDAVIAMTGKDYMVDITEYKDYKSAIRIVKKFGSVEKAVTAKLGKPMTNLLFAQRGDVVMFEHESIPSEQSYLKQAIGICGGLNIYCCTTKGVVEISMDNAKKVWNVND